MDAELAGSLWESQDSKRGPVLSHGSAAPSMTQIQAPPWKAVSVPAKHGGGAVHTSEVVHESKGWFYLKKKRGSIKTSSLAQRIYPGPGLHSSHLSCRPAENALVTQPDRLALDTRPPMARTPQTHESESGSLVSLVLFAALSQLLMEIEVEMVEGTGENSGSSFGRCQLGTVSEPSWLLGCSHDCVNIVFIPRGRRREYVQG